MRQRDRWTGIVRIGFPLRDIPQARQKNGQKMTRMRYKSLRNSSTSKTCIHFHIEFLR